MNHFTPTFLSQDEAFQSRVDSADPFVCSREDIQALIDDAPDAYSQGFLAGVASFREQLAILTNRPY